MLTRTTVHDITNVGTVYRGTMPSLWIKIQVVRHGDARCLQSEITLKDGDSNPQNQVKCSVRSNSETYRAFQQTDRLLSVGFAVRHRSRLEVCITNYDRRGTTTLLMNFA